MLKIVPLTVGEERAFAEKAIAASRGLGDPVTALSKGVTTAER